MAEMALATKASDSSKENYQLTHRHVNARFHDSCFIMYLFELEYIGLLASFLQKQAGAKKLGPKADLTRDPL